MNVPPAPRTSAGTRLVMAALDAFEDELRFYAGIGGTDLTQGRDSRDEHDAAGNILGTLLPGGGGGTSDAAGLGLGYRESTVEGAAAGTGTVLRARVAGSGETVYRLGWSSLDYQPVPLGRSGVAEPSPVPVPAGFPLLLAGLAALAGLRRRR